MSPKDDLQKFKVIIPPKVTLKGFVRECYNEEVAEGKAREKIEAQERERKALSKRAEESTNRVIDAIFAPLLKRV